MSPEQCQGKDVDNTSDIYSLGVVLFEMLTGRVPYNAEEHTGLMYKHINDRVPLLPPGLKRYQSLLNQMMAKDKEKRLKSGQQVINIIDKLAAKKNKGFKTKKEFRVSWPYLSKKPEALQPPPEEKVKLKIEPRKKRKITNLLGSKIKILLERILDRKNIKRLFKISVTAFILVVGIIIVLKFGEGNQAPIKENISQPLPILKTNQVQSKFEKTDIKFTPDPQDKGTYDDSVEVQLSFKPIRSPKGYEVSADIYYTLDGSDPKKTNERKYIPDNPIVIDKDGENILKARLFSRTGDYEGKLHTRTYTIQKIIQERKVEGGNAWFETASGTYGNPVKIGIRYKKLRWSKNEIIESKVYYTTDGSDPTKDWGQLYIKGNPIEFKELGTHILKARVISDDGNHMGKVKTGIFTIKPQIETVTHLNQLDPKTQDDIKEKTKKIVIEVEGIEKIDQQGRIQIFISRDGKAKVVDLGFNVEPTEKINEIKDALNDKIKIMRFLPPTMKGKSAEMKIWIEYKNISYDDSSNKIAFYIELIKF
jgi:hypothetical protein